MIVPSCLAYWEAIVPTSSTTSPANVPMDLAERDAKRRLTCVATQIVSMETVWINCTDTSKFPFFFVVGFPLCSICHIIIDVYLLIHAW